MNSTFLQQPTQNPMEYAGRIERMYPDVYKQIMPYVNSAVQQLGNAHNLSEEQLNSLTYQVVQSSGILRNIPRGHNNNTINDIVKVLLISTIMRMYHNDPPYNPYPPYPTPYPNPYPYPYPAPYPYTQPYVLPIIPGGGPWFGGGFHDGFRDGFRRR